MHWNKWFVNSKTQDIIDLLHSVKFYPQLYKSRRNWDAAHAVGDDPMWRDPVSEALR